MKKIKILLLIFAGLMLCSCASRTGKNYVRDIYLNKTDSGYEIIIKYYDFSSGDENYILDKYAGEDMIKTGISALSGRVYNFRLCENFYFSERLAENFDSVFSLITAYKLSPNVNIVCCEDNLTGEENFHSPHIPSSPLYNLSVTDGEVYGALPKIDGGRNISGMVLIGKDGGVYNMDVGRRQAAAIIMGMSDTGLFTSSDGLVYRNIGLVNRVFEKDDEKMTVKYILSANDIKGEGEGITRNERLKRKMEKSLSEDFSEAYRLLAHSGVFSYDGYMRIKGLTGQPTEFTIKIL